MQNYLNLFLRLSCTLAYMSSTNEPLQHCLKKPNKVLQYANASRIAGLYTDIGIKFGKKCFQAHRLILSCYSSYFKTMFETEMKEKYADIVTIDGVDASSLESLLNFIYTEEICINQQNVFDLLAASDYLQFDDAKQLCFDFLSSILSVETCFKVLNMADLYQNNYLLNQVFEFISENFAQILSNQDFKFQPKKYLLEILVNLNSDCVEERLVYDAIIGWVKHEEKRKDYLTELFQRLNLNKFSLSFLAETVATEALVIENHSCLKLVTKTLVANLQERVSRHPSKILGLGGEETQNEVFAVYGDDGKVYPALPQKVNLYCLLNIDDFVYCIGTTRNDFEVSTVGKIWRLKLYEINMKWEKVTSITIEKYNLRAAVYKNGIVVTDRYDEEGNLSAKFFDPLLNQWSALPSMNQDRSGHALVTYNGCLYCLGGYNYDDHATLSSVVMLSDVNGFWQPVEPMQTERDEFTAVSIMDTIYAIGGRDNQLQSIKSVEKYDPHLNKWVYVNEMNIARWGHSACVMQNKIYVVGGKNSKHELVTEIECYDLLNGNWSIVGNTNKKLYVYSVTAI